MTLTDLKDPLWRMQNLYSCRAEGSGRGMKFTPRPEQEAIIRHLLVRPNVPVYVIKSRRLGISTCVDTFMADQAAFGQGFRGVILDQTQADATKKMVEIVRFAFDSLPQMIRDRFVKDAKRNDSELRFRLLGEEESKDSAVFAATRARGGDCSMLHVSEWGPIAAEDPSRSKEIRTGALPAARLGRRVVETTWAGGKGGDLWDLVKPILEKDPNAEGILYFFPWHTDPTAIKLEGTVTEQMEDYFRTLGDKTGKVFSQEQKKWYASKALEQGIFVRREYPSTLDEAFSAPVEGSIYGDVLSAARTSGHVIHFEWDRDWPVFACWDIGWSDSTAIWLVQQVGLDYHWIWFTQAQHKTAADMMQRLVESGIPLAGHLLPHDAAAKKPGEGTCYRDSLVAAGGMNVKVVPRCNSIWDGVNRLRTMFGKSYFRVPAVEQGLAALEAYHTKPMGVGNLSRDEVHDWASHPASAARTYAEAQLLGMINTMAARKAVASEPRYPDGSIADPGFQQERRKLRLRATALSGHTPFP